MSSASSKKVSAGVARRQPAARVMKSASGAAGAAAEAAAAAGADGSADDDEDEDRFNAAEPETGEEIATLKRMLLAAQEESANQKAQTALQEAATAAARAEASRLARELAAARAGDAQAVQSAAHQAMREAGDAAQRQQASSDLAALQQRLEEERRSAEGAAGAALGMEAMMAMMERMVTAHRATIAPAAQVGQSAKGASASGERAAAAAEAAEARAGANRLKQRKLPELRASEASKGTVLADWMFELRRALVSESLMQRPWPEQFSVVQLFWDRAVDEWFGGQAELLRVRGQPIESWTTLEAALRTQYTPVAEADTAFRELITLRARGAESMEAFTARAQQLLGRIPPARMATEWAAELLLIGAEPSHYPLAVSSVKLEQQKERSRNSGKGLSFEAVRALLVEAAAREPNLRITSVASAASSAAHGGGSSKARQVISALRSGQNPYEALASLEPQELASALEREVQDRVNALQLGAGASKAPKPTEQRGSCHYCGGAGHYIAACPDKRAGKPRKKRAGTGGGEGQAEGSAAGPSPKNE